MSEQYQYILEQLPYGPGFCFVDEILYVDNDRISGNYAFKPEAFFYRDHFPGKSVTPGVILIEVMAQIGLVAFGIYLLQQGEFSNEKGMPLFTSSEIEFSRIVFPGERVEVRAVKKFFRLNKLKVFVEMLTADGQLVAKGHLSGILKTNTIMH